MNPFAPIGRATMTLLAHIGGLSRFTGTALAAIVAPPIYGRLIGQQIMRIGYYSLPVVGLTAFFTGGALALQIYLGGNRYGAEAIVPQIVVLAITRELGPVIAGLMVAVGALMVSTIRFPSSKHPRGKVMIGLLAVCAVLLALLQTRFFVLFFLLYVSATLLLNIAWKTGWSGVAPPRVYED